MMFKKLIEDKKLAGLNCLVWKNGQVIYKENQGYKNLETLELMPINTIFRISSMTKPITSVLAMKLYEENKLNLNDPITKWFPQFGNMKVLNNRSQQCEAAIRDITVLDLLTHRAGFTYGGLQNSKIENDYLVALGGDIDSLLLNREWLNNLSNLPLLNQPGTLFNYGRSTDLLGILISTIENKSLGAVMEEKIFSPLSMNDTLFSVPVEKKYRCAENFGYDEQGSLIMLDTVPLKMAFKERPDNLEFESGGQGLWSTVDDYLKFARIFVENGKSDSIQVLKPETIKLMCSDKLTDMQKKCSKLMGVSVFDNYYGFGLGLAIVTKANDYGSMPCSGTCGSVGWPGAYGGWWSADPVKKTISIFLTHSMTEPKQIEQGIGWGLHEAIDIFSRYTQGI